MGEVGAASEKTATRAESASDRMVRAQIKQVQQFEQMQRASRQYSQLTSSDLSKATEWFDRTYGSASKVTDATMKVATASETAGLGLGRLRQSLSSLVSQVTSTNPIVGRLASTFGVFEAGSETMVGVLAGLAAFGAYVEHLTAPMRKLREEQDKVIESLTKLRKLQGAGPGGEKVGQVQQLADRIASDNAAIARLNTAAHSVTSGLNPAAGFFQERRADAAKKEMGDLVADRNFAQNQIREAELKGSTDTNNTYVERLASLIRYHGETKIEHANALALYKDYRSQLAYLAKSHPEQLAMRATLGANIETLGGALFPKKRAAKKPAFLDPITTGSAALKQAVGQITQSYEKNVTAADKAIASRSKFLGTQSISKDTIDKVLLASGSPQMKAFNDAADTAKVTQARIDVQNAIRQSHGQGPIDEGKGTVMDTYRKAAVAASSAVADALQAAGMKGQALQRVLDGLNKTLKEIGANAPKTDQSSLTDKIASGLRTGADAANLFGGKRGPQIGNILNTAANAATNVTAAIADPMNPIADAQAALSIASLGKQIFGLGGQSHDAARAVREASESIKTMIASLAASVNYDALGGQLAAAQAADDARKSQINSSLSGKKKEAERNAQLQADDALFAKQKQQITQQYSIQQGFDKQSLQARLDRAKGLSYQADLEDLAVKQQEEMNAAILAGRDAAYLASLAQTQLAEKTQLANNAITQLANAPTGFSAERYFGQFSTPQGFPGITPPTASLASTQSNQTSTVNTGDIHIAISGTNKDPLTIAKETVAEIRKLGTQYGGMGATLADTMELMS